MDPVEPEVVETEYTPTPEDLTPEEVTPGPDEVVEESPLVGEEPPAEGVVEQDTEPAPVDDTPLYEEVAGDLGLGLEEPSTPDLYTVESEPTEETWATVPEAPLQEIETPENEDEEAASTPEESFLVEEFQGAEDATQALLEYELEGRDAPEASWRPLARVPADQLEAEVLGLPAGEEWEVRVRGHLADGTTTDWSAPAPVTLPVDMVPPDLPSAPLATGGIAGVTVRWDGRTASGGVMPADFARLIIWHSLTGATGTWVRKHSLSGPDQILVTDLKAGQAHYFAFTAVDETGNESGLSAIASAEVEILVDTAEIEAALAAARAELAEATAEAGRQFAELGQITTQARADLDDARQRVDSAEQALGSLDGEVDGLQSRLSTAEGNITAAAEQAEEGLSALDETLRKAFSDADAALKSEAASDATAKANAVPRPFHETTAPTSANAAPDGSVWFQHSGTRTGPIIAQWARVVGAWVSTPIRSEAIANLDVGRLTAGSAVVDEAVTQKLLANEAIINRLTVGVQAWIDGVLIKDGAVTAKKITVTDELITNFFAANRALINEELVVRGRLIADHATIISAALKNLSVAEKATFAQAFADEFWAKMAVVEKLTAQAAWIGGAQLKDGAITADHITASEAMSSKLGQFLKVKAGQIEANAFTGQTFAGGTFSGTVLTGGTVQSDVAANRGVKMDTYGIRAFRPDGTQSFSVNASTGNVTVYGGRIEGGAVSATAMRGPVKQEARLEPGVFGAALYFTEDGVNQGSVGANGIYGGMEMRGPATSDGQPPAAVTIDRGNTVMVQAKGEPTTRGTLRLNKDQAWVGLGSAWGVLEHGILIDPNQTSLFGTTVVTKGALTAAGPSEFLSAASFKDNATVSGTLFANGRLRNSGAGNTSYASNVYMDSYGILYKSSSASRYKLNQQVADVDDALLDLPVKTWQDREAVETAEELSSRIGPLTEADTTQLDAAQRAAADTMFGVIAEDVEKVDPRLATYDADGRVEGVAYDRFGPALIPLVRRQRDRIAELEKQVDALASRLDAAGL